MDLKLASGQSQLNCAFGASTNFMNTTYDDNQDFYGKVFAKGDVDINGSFNDLTINVNRLETLKNTEFIFPYPESS